MLLKMAMENKGYQTEEATNGEEAIAVYQRCQPDLVILDAMMPIMDGFQTCENICALNKENNQEIPIVMLTFLDDKESIDKAFSAGATDYITKPIHWPVLFQRVKYLLNFTNHSFNEKNFLLEFNQLKKYETILSTIINENELINQDLLDMIRVFLKADIAIFYDAKNNSVHQSCFEDEDICPSQIEELKKLNLLNDYLRESQPHKIINVNSIQQANLNFECLSILNKFQIQSWTVVPIMSKNKVINLLGLYKRVKAENNWQENDLKRLKNLTNLLSLKNVN
jgi:CheY-like chemotaxis protein